MCEDYAARTSGVPDLIVWRDSEDPAEREAKFVEVKGPGDSLQENQKVCSPIHAHAVPYLDSHFTHVGVDRRSPAGWLPCGSLSRPRTRQLTARKGAGQGQSTQDAQEGESGEDPDRVRTQTEAL